MMEKKELNILKKSLFYKLNYKDENSKSHTRLVNEKMIKYSDFESGDSIYSWHIVLDKRKKIFKIEHLVVRDLLLGKAYSEILLKLKESYSSAHEDHLPIVAAILGPDNKLLSIKINVSNTNKKDGHAEQLCLNEINDFNLPINKLKIIVTLIPCIECFKKIYECNNIHEIIVLKQYQNTLVQNSHAMYIRDIEPKLRRQYKLLNLTEKSKNIRKIGIHHDAYLIKNRIVDLINKPYILSLNNKKNKGVDFVLIPYKDMEKWIMLSRYIDKEILELNIQKNTLFVDSTLLKKEIKKMISLYGWGKGDNPLIGYLENIYFKNTL